MLATISFGNLHAIDWAVVATDLKDRIMSP